MTDDTVTDDAVTDDAVTDDVVAADPAMPGKALDPFGIDGNEAVLRELVQLLHTEKAIAFVGAGASAPLYPLWEGFVRQLAEHAVATRKADSRQQRYWCRKAGDRPDRIAKQIRDELDPGEFASFLRKTFGVQRGADGLAFTPTHAALARLPFQGYVTTNYDAGLEEACAELRRDHKPKPFHWGDNHVSLWCREAPGDQRELPILHAHGQITDIDSIVLGIDEYRRVYTDQHAYLDLLGHLMGRERLVFVGFGFTDPWLTSFVDRVATLSGIRKLTAPRHIAIIGLPDDERDEADLIAAEIEESLRARVCFYPIHKDSHAALGQLLDVLQRAVTPPRRRSPAPTSPPPAAKVDLLDRWLDFVIDTHRRLVDCFDRPGQLSLIEEAWVELQVRAGDLTVGGEPGKGAELVGRRLKLAQVLALEPHSEPWITGRWLLEGSPGSGKTTMLRHYARTLATSRSRSHIPLFVSLSRVVGQAEPWLLTVTEGFRALYGPEIVGQLDTAGREGRLVVLLDGLDEVPPERRSTVTALRNFLRRDWPKCPVVLSTRPLGRGQLPKGYPRLDLLPLAVERQAEFLVKWFRHGGADPAKAEAEAEAALACFGESRGLADLAGIPLYLILLALLWQNGRRPPERLALLYDQIFDFLLEGRHRTEAVPIPAPGDVRSALRHLAQGLTHDELLAEPPKHLEQRLRAPELEDVRSRLETVGPWRNNLRRFFDDVYERTQILGPHDGHDTDWRFWHRTFREALTAEYLHQRFGDDLEALAGWARDLPDDPEQQEGRGEGRWAEPLALLAGRLPEPDALVARLAEVKPGLALRSMVFTQGLQAKTLHTLLGLTPKLDERAEVFEKIPEQLGDPQACLELVERLKEGRPGGFDLFWLGWILDQVEVRWPGFAKVSQAAQGRLFEFLPPPPGELFEAVETRDGQKPLWCPIPQGHFWMGSPEGEKGRDDDEGPRHEVSFRSSFHLAAVPVTQAQYAAFEPDHRSKFEGTHRPVDSVTWYQAMAFCRWLGSHGHWRGARLPTEAEWEYACRAGTTTCFWSGDTEKDLRQVAWYDENSKSQTHNVGQKAPNPWGLYDVHGNVWEWTASPWTDYSDREAGITADPAGLPADLAGLPRGLRVFRGGCFWVGALVVRSAYRSVWGPRDRDPVLGFRVLLPFAPSDRRT